VGRREDGLIAGEEATVFNPTSTDPASIVTATQRSLSEVITVYYWREDGGNLLTTTGLAKMREVEKCVGFDATVNAVTHARAAERSELLAVRAKLASIHALMHPPTD
jgi:hypothetical protein